MDHPCDTHSALGVGIMPFFHLSLWPVVLRYQLLMSLFLLESLKTIFLLDELEAAAETKNTLYLSGYWISLKCYLILFTWKGPPQPEVYKPSASSKLSLHCNYCECNLLKQLWQLVLNTAHFGQCSDAYILIFHFLHLIFFIH